MCRLSQLRWFLQLNYEHNIIQMHNNVLWDWQYYAEYSSNSTRMMEYYVEYCPSRRPMLYIWIMLWREWTHILKWRRRVLEACIKIFHWVWMYFYWEKNLLEPSINKYKWPHVFGVGHWVSMNNDEWPRTFFT